MIYISPTGNGAFSLSFTPILASLLEVEGPAAYRRDQGVEINPCFFGVNEVGKNHTEMARWMTGKLGED